MGVPESRTMPSIVPANNDEYSHETRPALRAIDAGVAFDRRSVGGREKAGEHSESGTGDRTSAAAEAGSGAEWNHEAKIRGGARGAAGAVGRKAEASLDAACRKCSDGSAPPAADPSDTPRPAGTGGSDSQAASGRAQRRSHAAPSPGSVP